MKTVTIEQAKSALEKLIYELDESLLIIESDDGEPLAVLTSVRMLDDLDTNSSYSRRTLYEILGEANRRIEEDGGIAAEDFWAQVEAEHPDPVVEET